MLYKYYIMIRLLLIRNGFKRAEFIKRKGLFHCIGNNCYYHPWKIPRESFLITFGNNVVVASGVTFITHDVIGLMLKHREDSKDCGRILLGTINVGNNVFIGANSVILPNITIGSDSIIAAGSVVTSNVPEHSVVGGNPARVIKNLDAFIEKRRSEIIGIPSWLDSRTIIEDYFYGDLKKEDSQNENS